MTANRFPTPALLLALAACSGTGPTGVDDLDHNLALWNSQGISNYSYVIRYTCLCSFGGTPVRVEVIGGQVVSRTSEIDGSTVGNESGRFGTIPDLFQHIRELIRQGPVRHSIEYHPDLGYPKSYFVDLVGNVLDDEESAIISEFLTPLTQ